MTSTEGDVLPPPDPPFGGVIGDTFADSTERSSRRPSRSRTRRPPSSSTWSTTTDGADVGRVATEAAVETLVLYHLIPGNPGITDDAWTAMVRPQFAGRIIVAKDLLVV